MSGEFPFSAVRSIGSPGFYGPPAKPAGIANSLIVHAAITTAGDAIGPGLLLTNYDYVQHALVTPDPGADYGSISGTVGGFTIAGVVNVKLGSPFRGVIIFTGNFALTGKTVKYIDNLGDTITSNLDGAHLTAVLGLGAGFTCFFVDFLFGFVNNVTNPLTLTFNF